MPMSFQVTISEAMTAQCSPPPSEPAKSELPLFSTIGRLVRFDDVGLDIDAAVVKEAGQAFPRESA
jgi:hypothetical protein